MAWLLPCWALIGDQDVRGKETERRLAHFYSLIAFTGPQSHLRNHGDADKVTHDYSSMAPPDWTAPKSPAKRIHQRSLCSCSTSICPWGWRGSISAALSLFFTLTSGFNPTPSSLLSNYLSSLHVPPISLAKHLSRLLAPLPLPALNSVLIDEGINLRHTWHELLLAKSLTAARLQIESRKH